MLNRGTFVPLAFRERKRIECEQLCSGKQKTECGMREFARVLAARNLNELGSFHNGTEVGRYGRTGIFGDGPVKGRFRRYMTQQKVVFFNGIR